MPGRIHAGLVAPGLAGVWGRDLQHEIAGAKKRGRVGLERNPELDGRRRPQSLPPAPAPASIAIS